MHKKRGRKLTRLSAATAGLLAVLQVASAIPAQALGTPDVKSSVMKTLIDETSTELAPGVQEKDFAYKEQQFQWRTQCFCIDVASGNQASISLGTPNDGTKYEMQTVRNQANAAIANGKTVVAAVNGDYYNMATGEPQGVEIKNGKEIHTNRCNEPFFGIKEDGTPVIGDKDAYQKVKGELKEAIGGPRILVKDGQSTNQTDIYYPCTAVGIRDNNSVFFLVIDGVQLPYSEGITLQDLTQLLIDMGAKNALMLDGGGSSTCVERAPGESSLSCRNSPSDGRERTVANSVLISSNKLSDEKFVSAYITPQDKTYSPDSSVQMKAVGLDVSGAPAQLPPSGLTWSLSDPSFGTIDSTGLLTSNGKEGQVQVKLSDQGNTVGTTNIEFAMPDEIGFLQSASGLSLKSNTEQDLGLIAQYKGRDVTLKPDDIQWSVTDGVGTVNAQNVLHTTSGVASGTVAATVAGTKLSASISVKVGQVPQILYDFEDGLSGWSCSTAGRGEQTDISLTSSSDDPHSVRFGQHALKLSFDLTNAQKGTTLGAYAGPSGSVAISGSPSAIGMWVYATPEAQGYWLRMYLYDGSGTFKPINFTQEGIGINWTGWKYVEAPIPGSYQGPYKTFPAEMVRLMSTKSGNTGPMTKGYIYVDNVSAVYGSNNVDTVSPAIDQIRGYSEREDSDALNGKCYDHNDINIMVNFHDDNSDGKSAGINWDNSTIFVDGRNYSSDQIHYSYDKDGILNLRGIHWADGVHKVTADIYDGFGNETVKDAYFTVNTGNTKVGLIPDAKSAALGGTYQINLTANNAADVQSVTAKIKVDKDYPVTGVTFDPSVAGSSSYTYDNETGIVSVNIGQASNKPINDPTVLAAISVNVPVNTKEGSKLEYSIESASIEYNSEKGDEFAPTFSAEPGSIPVAADYRIAMLNSIVGKDGKLQVIDQNSKPVADAVITEKSADGSEMKLGKTGSDGTLTNSGLTASAREFTLQAEKEGQYSFVLSAQSYNPVKDKTPCNILSGSTPDPTTEKTITWMDNPLAIEGTATMQYTTTADYTAKGENAFQKTTGSSKTLYYDSDSSAVCENSVTVTGLKPGTEYSYRVGDGTNWSKVMTFATPTNTGKFTFNVFGDTQSTESGGLDSLSNIFSQIEKKPQKPLFTLHVGDFVDDEQVFGEIDTTAAMFNQHPSFNSIDMIHVLGNHEYQGDDGTKGALIYGVPQNGPSVNKQGCYSMNYGNMHISVIGWTDNAATMQEELNWLRHDVNTSHETWYVVATHQPPYNKNPGDSSTLFNQMLTPVCDGLGIDFVFSGHDHSYGRTYPLVGGKKIDSGTGTVYVCAGHTAEKTYDISPADPSVYAFVQSDMNDKTYITGSVDDNKLTITANKFDGTVMDTYTATAKTRADKSMLEDTVSKAASYQQSIYTAASWEALQDVMKTVQATYNNPNASQTDIDSATKSIDTAIEGLIKVSDLAIAKEALDSELEKAATYQQKDYSPDSWSNLASTVEAGNSANDGNDISEIKAASEAIESAIKGLVLSSDKTKSAIGSLDPDSTDANTIVSLVNAVSHFSSADKQSLTPTEKANLEAAIVKTLLKQAPIQTVTTTDDNAIQNVSADALALAAGVTETNSTVSLALTQATPQSGEAVKFDLALTKNGQGIEPMIPVTVTVTLPADFFKKYPSSNYTYTLKHNGPTISSKFDPSNDKVTFTTDSFSPFTVVATPKSSPSNPSGPVTPVAPTAPVTFVSDTNSALSVNGAYTFKITSKDGKAPVFVVGTPGSFTVQLVQQSGNDYFYKITAIGAAGAQAGVYVNGTKLLVATVKSGNLTFVSDTGSPLSVNSAYTFKITSKNGKPPVFVVGTPGIFTTQLVKHTGNDYFYKITAIGAPGDQAGVYVNGTKLLVATVKTNPSYVLSDTHGNFKVTSGKAYVFKLTANAKPNFQAGTPSAFKVSYVNRIGNNYYFRVTAVGKAGSASGFYIQNQKGPVAVAAVA